MHSKSTRSFRSLYAKLPKSIKAEAKKAYLQFKTNPSHPGLQFKCVQKKAKVYSARINLDYRVLGTLDGNEILWMWIGSHDEYDKLI